MPVRILMPNGEPLAERARRARGVMERAKGLLGGSPLSHGEALVLEPGAQVHTIGMRYPIDVVFCDDRWMVLHIVRCMRPNRMTRWVFGARRAIELPAGAVPAELSVGDVLVVEP